MNYYHLYGIEHGKHVFYNAINANNIEDAEKVFRKWIPNTRSWKGDYSILETVHGMPRREIVFTV